MQLFRKQQMNAPFILTVDWLGWVCYLPDKLEFILSYHVLPS